MLVIDIMSFVTGGKPLEQKYTNCQWLTFLDLSPATNL